MRSKVSSAINVLRASSSSGGRFSCLKKSAYPRSRRCICLSIISILNSGSSKASSARASWAAFACRRRSMISSRVWFSNSSNRPPLSRASGVGSSTAATVSVSLPSAIFIGASRMLEASASWCLSLWFSIFKKPE